MDLALHVGTLTDYFLVALQRAQASDPEAPPAPPRDQVEERVLEWRAFVSDGLVRNGHLAGPLEWPEVRQPTWTIGLPSHTLQALRLLLVHGTRGEVEDAPEPPDHLPEAPESHPVWVAATRADFENHPQPNLLVPEFWLPGDQDFTFPCPYPDGHEVQTGWTGRLLEESRAVADDLLIGGSGAAAALAERAPPARSETLRALAAHACAVFVVGAERAVRQRLPLLVHA